MKGSWVHGFRPAEARQGRCGPGLVLQMRWEHVYVRVCVRAQVCPEPGSPSSLCSPLISKMGAVIPPPPGDL